MAQGLVTVQSVLTAIKKQMMGYVKVTNTKLLIRVPLQFTCKNIHIQTWTSVRLMVTLVVKRACIATTLQAHLDAMVRWPCVFVLETLYLSFAVDLQDCDKSCEKVCSGPGPARCAECAVGYTRSEHGTCKG